MTARPPRPGEALPVGTRVRVRRGPPEFHCRTPTYLRGAVGEIAAVVGYYRDPSRLALHKPGLPMRLLYRVRFRQIDIWPAYEGPPADSLFADLYGHWLDPLTGDANGNA